MKTLRRIVFRILDPESTATALERGGNIAIGVLIVANVVAVIVESVPWIHDRFALEFEELEVFSVAVFTVEYALRLWTCVEKDRYRHPILGRLRFIVSPLALIDLAVILPAYLPGEMFLDLRFARIVRVVRMLRVLKFARYSRTLRTFGAVFEAKRADISLVTLFLMLLVVLASSVMYFVEHPAQPQSFSSIPAAMWWTVMTLTTVGYGDIYPITPVGKLLGAIIALIGIGFFALPAGLLAAAFADELAKQREKRKPRVCPHCGKELALE